MRFYFGSSALIATALWIVVASVPSLAMDSGQQALVIEDAWSPQMPPNVSMAAGYLTVVNISAVPVTITSLSSPAYHAVAIHRSLIENGVASMVKVKDLVINPGQRLKLSPGGLHIMLMNRKSKSASTESLPIELKLDDGNVIDVTLNVIPGRVQSPQTEQVTDHSKHMHHGS